MPRRSRPFAGFTTKVPRANSLSRGGALIVAALPGLALAGLARPAFADLQEQDVLLVYNSNDPESNAIAAEYVERHPDVLTCDLDVDYTSDYQLEPPNCGITSRYITPCKFHELFLDPAGPFQTCLAALDPKPLCIVTTRGLPVAISDTTSPIAAPCEIFAQPCHGMYAAVEAVLTRIGLPQPGGGAVGDGDLSIAYDLIANAYYTDDSPYIVPDFESFLDDACIDTNGVVCRGKMFLASRLDAGPGNFDWDGDTDIDNVDGVIAVLRNAEFPQVNQYAVSALFDTDGEGLLSGTSAENETVGACIAMWDDLWCSLHESTLEFIHGPNDGCFDEETDGPYAQWPIIAMQTFGRNHVLTTEWCDPADPPELETILASYVWQYQPHPLGVFLSVESFNGWQLHAGDGTYGTDPVIQGQVLEWFRAGGGFAVGNIYEPTTGHIADARVLYRNFFGAPRLSWGEASTASLKSLGIFSVPIGDPLVVLTVYNPDVNGDRKVDNTDYQIVLLALGTSNPVADINDDGIVDQKDINLVREAYGQNCTEQPTEPFPGMGCGDLGSDNPPYFNVDWIVDSIDLGIFYQAWTDAGGNPAPAPCPLLECWADCPCVGDFNGDAIIDTAEEMIILANCGRFLLDIAGNDGCVTAADHADLLLALESCQGDPNFNPMADINCDGCITRGIEQSTILENWGECENPDACEE